MVDDATIPFSLRDEGPKLHCRKMRIEVVKGADVGSVVELPGPEARIGSGANCDLVIKDPTVSRLHLVVRIEGDLIRITDAGSRNGTLLDSVRIVDAYARPDSMITLGGTTLRLRMLNDVIELPLSIRERIGRMHGRSIAMRRIFAIIERVAPTDSTILIEGETGTGKELAAEAIHDESRRANAPFVVFDCSAVSASLIESELFGHVRGAFTGAVMNRPGKFQVADKGTLFLDEIGELPLNLQVKLLRALQERVVFRVGDSKPEKVDIRVVAATNRNLEEEIRNGNFREDLYYRLNVVNLWLPPLRDRGDDVMIIAKVLLSKYADELKSQVRGFSPASLSAIKKCPWPGNIRQLENRIKKALVLCDQTLLSPEDLDLGASAENTILPLEKAKEDFQRKYVLEVLERNNGNRTQTARDLGVDPRTIFRYLEKEANPMPSAAGGVAKDPPTG